jgi:hypothetical protein
MDRSFLSGYQLSPADFLAAKHVAEHDLENLANVKRWYTHVKAHASEAKSLENKELCKSDTGNKKTRKVSGTSYLTYLNLIFLRFVHLGLRI